MARPGPQRIEASAGFARSGRSRIALSCVKGVEEIEERDGLAVEPAKQDRCRSLATRTMERPLGDSCRTPSERLDACSRAAARASRNPQRLQPRGRSPCILRRCERGRARPAGPESLADVPNAPGDHVERDVLELLNPGLQRGVALGRRERTRSLEHLHTPFHIPHSILPQLLETLLGGPGHEPSSLRADGLDEEEKFSVVHVVTPGLAFAGKQREYRNEQRKPPSRSSTVYRSHRATSPGRLVFGAWCCWRPVPLSLIEISTKRNSGPLLAPPSPRFSTVSLLFWRSAPHL